jgi:hypothetical protein
MLAAVVTELTRGLQIGGSVLYAKQVMGGRFSEEMNLPIHVRRGGHDWYFPEGGS